MMRLFLLWLTARLTKVELGENGDYLHRWFLYKGTDDSHGVYIHRFLRSDGDQELHDHMWPGFSIVLVGSYREEKMTQWNNGASFWSPLTTKIVRWFNVIGKDDFHRVDLQTSDVWTLFIRGPKAKSDWGFIDRNTLEYTDQETFRLRRDGVAPKDID